MIDLSEAQREVLGRRGFSLEQEHIKLDFVPYEAPQTIKRQMFWLSWISQGLGALPPPKKLLDIGSNLFWLCGVASKYDVEMVDVRPHPLANHFPFKMKIGDAVSLPYEKESFDVVTFPQLLHWLGTAAYGGDVDMDADFRALSEISRVLKKDGSALFVTFVAPGNGVFKVNGRRLYGISDLKDVVSRAGLKMDSLEFYSPDFKKISPDQLSVPTGRELVPGNPDEDICWAFARASKSLLPANTQKATPLNSELGQNNGPSLPHSKTEPGSKIVKAPRIGL
jgi:SAM-dependent methyltransferase